MVSDLLSDVIFPSHLKNILFLSSDFIRRNLKDQLTQSYTLFLIYTLNLLGISTEFSTFKFGNHSKLIHEACHCKMPS